VQFAVAIGETLLPIGSAMASGYHWQQSPIIRGIQVLAYDSARLADCAQAIAAAGRKLGAQGLTPATSSNFSMRLDGAHAAVTISGRDKGALSPDDVMVVDMEGRPVGTSARPSAETLLHTLRRRPRGAAYALARADRGLASVRTGRRDAHRRL
jgi:methylthioribulose-1-phosphate dehydratase